jgi:NADH-quinone oxidoreductase subunit L
MCSGSVIHAVHTNEMPEMGGLLKKMPWTAYTMLIGCLAIAGAGIPFVIGFSGYYSKDAILEQAHSFWSTNPGLGAVFFGAAAGGAAITAFYMFRMWYMTFLGKPRNHHRYDHAHESPWVMVIPLVILAVFAMGVAWPIPGLNLTRLLEQARPAGIAADTSGAVVEAVWPNEHDSHDPAHVIPATLIAFCTALAGIGLATVFYVWR